MLVEARRIEEQGCVELLKQTIERGARQILPVALLKQRANLVTRQLSGAKLDHGDRGRWQAGSGLGQTGRVAQCEHHLPSFGDGEGLEGAKLGLFHRGHPISFRAAVVGFGALRCSESSSKDNLPRPADTRTVPSILLLLPLCFALAPLGQASEVLFVSETSGQAYQVRAGDGSLFSRRRLVQSLGIDVLVDPFAEQNQIAGSIRLRLDAQLDDYRNLGAPSGRSAIRNDGPAAVELLHAYVEGRRLLGVVDLRLGRQWQLEPFRLRAFDGAALEVTTPLGLVLQGWGGLGISGQSPIDSPLYRQDGLALDRNPRPSDAERTERLWQPTFGVGVRTVDNRFVDARLWYVRTNNLLEDTRPAVPRLGISEERLNLSARGVFAAEWVRPYVDLSANLMLRLVDDLAGGISIGKEGHRAAVDYVRSLPTFDGDSIWNVFASSAFDDVRVGYDHVGRGLAISTRAFLRRFSEQAHGGRLLGGANGSFAFRVGRSNVRFNVHGEGGDGLTAGVSGLLKLRLWGDLSRFLDLEGRVSFLHVEDPERPNRRIDSLGLQAGLRWQPLEGLAVHVLVEENANRVVVSQLRILAMLDVAYTLHAKPRGRVRRPGFLP